MENINNRRSKISVCIPCYNVNNFLDKLFTCLDNQTFKALKLIFIDDGSTDGTYDKILEYKKRCQYEMVTKLQKNSGIAITRNRLLDLVDTEYLFFIDPDDEMPKNALEILYKATNNGQYDIVTGRAKVVFNEQIAFPFIATYRYKNNITSGHYVKSNLCTVWASLFKASVFYENRFLDNYIFEDSGILSYIFLKNTNFKQIKDIVYFYNRRKKVNSLSTFSKINRWKFIDLYEQTKYSFEHYKKENWLTDKKYLRLINGTLYQTIISNLWLSKYFSNNVKLSVLPMWQLLDCLKNYGIHLKFSKTFWKSLSFFYLNWNPRYKSIVRYIKNESRKRNKFLLTVNDFILKSSNKFIKQKIYFLDNNQSIKISDIAAKNIESTFLIDEKYRDKLKKEYLNVSIGTTWSKFDKNKTDIQYVDARELNEINKSTLDKLLLIPKYIMVFLDKRNLLIDGIDKYLNFIFF